MIIGASYLVSVPIGIATTLAVIAHDSARTRKLLRCCMPVSHGAALLFNFLSACAVSWYRARARDRPSAESFSAAVLPVAGGFIYIAGSALVPELHKERSFPKSVAQLIAIGAGIGLMLCLTLME
jgi:zinc and cadmium transporter